ncbi:hypothetical protein CBS11852_11467 [Aspergillus niger]|nr:hypothetical protein CBS11852_11467 [Aspergillus niger]
MADPPAGAPEPLGNMTTLGNDALENSESTTTRKTRRQARADNHQDQANSLIIEPSTAGTNTPRVTTKEIRQIIEHLQHTIEKQTTLIQATRTELREVKHNQRELQTQNEKLQDEIQTLRTQIEGLDAPNPTRSWAAVAADTNNCEPSKNRRTEKDKNCIRISTQPLPTDTTGIYTNTNEFGRYLPTSSANNHIRTALLNAPSTHGVQVAGVGTTKTGYVIRFKDPESAETARNNTEWLQELGHETRLVKPRYGVAVHHVPTQGLDLEKDKTGAIREIAQENDLQERGFRIEDIAWLKKKDKALGPFASLGIWFDSAEAANWMLDNGLLIDQRNSTIDQTLTDRPGMLLKCHLYHDNYGSDHRATYSEWSLRMPRNPDTKPRKAYERADWEKIGWDIWASMRPWETPDTIETLDATVEKLIQATATAIDKDIPNLQPSPYAKRWFTPDLKTQQKAVNQTRRKWQESCARAGRDDPYTKLLSEDMRQKRRTWTRAIEKAKTAHWKQFLDRAGERRLWKAATYMRPRESWSSVPALKVDNRSVTGNQEKAEAFMNTFFPMMAPAQEETPTRIPAELPWQPITELEVYRSLQAAKSSTAPGEDGLPMLIWKRLWRHLGNLITRIFAASIDLGYHPRKWRSARIVVLRKPGKSDYSIPGAYRPISLLNTLGKLLEAVMARRLSYLAEHYGLLPDTQFGGRPGRTTEQALLVLTNAIDRAWYGQRVVTLVAFDLKGAFNGVNKTSLDIRLQAKGIPKVARRWIASFMSGRQARIGFDDYCSEVIPLGNAGLAQGSPLSPILFAFFNSDLVDQPVNFHGGASAFIDDYFRWRVGRSAEENLAKLQSEDIPRIEAWARKTGSSFAAEKTELIHITRKRREQCRGQITINSSVITPSTTAKLLGVIFDHELRWKEHVQQAVKRATKVNVAIGGLRQLRPEQMRQLHEACVTPVVQYASTVWHDPLRDKTHLRQLRTVQRTALIRILSAFRTVATSTLDVEAYMLPIHLRLRQRAQTTITQLHTLPRKHPIREVLLRARRRRDNVGSHARFPLAEALKTMNLERLDDLEMIDPAPQPPWRAEAFSKIDIATNREIAMEQAEAARSESDLVVYSDASGRQGHLGAAAAVLDDESVTTESLQIQVGPTDQWSVHAAELIGILYAINLINRIVLQQRRAGQKRARTVTILSDSTSALLAIQKPGSKSGQQIIYAILQAAKNTRTHGVTIRLQWVPGHSEILGNDAADRLAKEAAIPGKTHPFSPLLSRERAYIRQGILTQWEKEWKESRDGGHLRKIDNTLPAKYTRRLYGALPRNRAYLLTQIRSGHCWLSTYGKLFGFRDDDRCLCGGRESIIHVLLDCPLLRDLRRELRAKVGDALNSMSVLLGGSGSCQEGGSRVSNASRTKTVEAVLDFAEASQRFRSRVP